MRNAQVAGVSASKGRTRRGSSSPWCSLDLTRDLAGIIARAFLTSGCYAKSEEHNTGRAPHDTSCSAAELLFPFLTEGEKMAFSHVLMISRSSRCCKLNFDQIKHLLMICIKKTPVVDVSMLLP